MDVWTEWKPGHGTVKAYGTAPPGASVR
jgi:hypothetical protein